MERTNWMLGWASHCCSFECITGVKCGVQDGSDAVAAAAIGKGDGGSEPVTAVAEAFRSFKRARETDGATQREEI